MNNLKQNIVDMVPSDNSLKQYFSALLIYNIEKINDIFYPVIMMLRQFESNSSNCNFIEPNITLITPLKEVIFSVPMSIFLSESERLLLFLNTRRVKSPALYIEDYIKCISGYLEKEISGLNNDIVIILNDSRSDIISDLGLKSDNPSLLYASKDTNFKFNVLDTFSCTKDKKDNNSILLSNNQVMNGIEYIKYKNRFLVFDKIDNTIFRNNLIMIDSSLPKIIAYLLLENLNTNVTSLKELVNMISSMNPLNYDAISKSLFYDCKIKRFLTALAFGMTSTSVWDYQTEAKGYIIINIDGLIDFYNFKNINSFEDYLLSHTYIDTTCDFLLEQNELSIEYEDIDNINVQFKVILGC